MNGKDATIFNITFDCADARAQAQFWAAALGWTASEQDDAPGHVEYLVEPPDGASPRLYFTTVPEPKTAKNRLHFDLISDTFEAEAERLLGLGARQLRELQSDKSRWITFADIEGNEFDLIAR